MSSIQPTTNTSNTDIVNSRIRELQNVLRLVNNTFNLVSNVDVKGTHCSAVAEILNWLQGFGSTIQSQISALEATLPAEAAKETTPKEEAKVG